MYIIWQESDRAVNYQVRGVQSAVIVMFICCM